MNRTALRLATVAALLHGGKAPYGTFAGEFVYDSMMDDIKEASPVKGLPVIVVRTDEDEKAFQQSNELVRHCRLLIEISMVTLVRDSVTGRLRTDWPETDSALEAMLDALEWQVWIALRGKGPWAEWYLRNNFYTITSYRSVPRFSSPARGSVRLSVRTLEFVVTVPPDCIPGPLHEYAPEELPFLPPSLVSVIEAILEYGDGAFKTSIQEIYASLKTYGAYSRPRYSALQRVWVKLPDYETEFMADIDQAAYLGAQSLTGGVPELDQPQVN